MHVEENFVVNEYDMQKQVKEAIPRILNWTQLFRGSKDYPKPTIDFGPDNGQMQVSLSEVVDIEEMVWAPKYGLKGMIDASLLVKVESNEKRPEEKILPLEFKTGKGTTGQSAVEHSAQVILYTLLMSERYLEDIDSGLLYYLHTDQTQGCVAQSLSWLAIIISCAPPPPPPPPPCSEARESVMGVSLFCRLSEAHPQALSALQNQYRMCAGIMDLSNALIYGDRFQCGSSDVKYSKLKLLNPGLMTVWLKKIQPAAGQTQPAAGQIQSTYAEVPPPTPKKVKGKSPKQESIRSKLQKYLNDKHAEGCNQEILNMVLKEVDEGILTSCPDVDNAVKRFKGRMGSKLVQISRSQSKKTWIV